MNVESFLKKKIGNVANKIHTGRSRNDQVATILDYGQLKPPKIYKKKSRI